MMVQTKKENLGYFNSVILCDHLEFLCFKWKQWNSERSEL